MANDALAPVEPPGTPSEDEYQTFCAALSASARGRTFLTEYARRNRGADTETLLAALARLEALVRAQARTSSETVHAELRGLLDTIRTARPELAQSALPARAAKLAVLLDLLERRIEALAEAAAGPAALGDAARLAVVPVPDEPELPIPTPEAAQPALTVAHERVPPPLPTYALNEFADSGAVIPEITWFDSTPPAAAAAEPMAALEPTAVGEPPHAPAMNEQAAASTSVAIEAAIPAATESDGRTSEPAAEQKPPALSVPANGPAADPLSVFLALSEEERVALFT